jgi:hypothetical protein
MSAKTELFGRWLQGSVVVEDQGKSTGRRFFVRSGIGSNTAGYGATPERPFATLAYAVTQATAGAQDIIYVMEGHAETVATTITPLAGTRIVGLGSGNLAPQFTPAANNLVALTLSADNVTVDNIYINEATVAASVANVSITGRHAHLKKLHMDMGANDRIGIRIGALGCYPVIEDCTAQVTANGPDSWITFVSANVDMPLIRNNHVIASDGADEFDDEIIDFGGLAVRNPVIVNNVFNGGGVAVASIDDAGIVVGPVFAGNKHGGLAVNNDNVPVGHMNIFDDAITADKIADAALEGAAFAASAGIWRTAVRRYDFAVDGGALGDLDLFTVTGDALVQVFGLCKTDLVGGAGFTFEVGIAGNTDAIIATTGGVDIDAGDTWQDAAPDANPGAVDLTARTFAIASGADITQTIGVDTATAGVIDYYCRWLPLSANGYVQPA